jgi:CPA2 family monovalent cation:H+ antiporter-2
MQIKKSVLLGGSVQVFLSIILGFLLSNFIGFSLGQGIFIGFLISLSSTAIVLTLIQKKGDVDTLHGKTILAILIFQDIIAIPMMLITPSLSGKNAGSGDSVYFLLFKIIFIIFFFIVSYKYLIPKLLEQIVKTRINELFLITIAGICFSVAVLTSSMGLSLALGAFMAGLIISESEYSHQALGHVLPFKDIFTSFFFVSIGMLLDINFFITNFFTIILLTILSLTIKFIAGFMAAASLGYSLRIMVLVGVAISQIGEFSFILSKVGLDNNLLTPHIYQIFLSVSILTMALTPLLINFSSKLADLILKIPFLANIKTGTYQLETEKDNIINNHIVIIGFGLNGKNLAQVAKKANIPYLILEMNPMTVKFYKNLGEPIYYGDATQEIILEHLNIKKARVVVVAISDPTATRKIIELIRRIDKSIYTVVRTRYVEEMKYLYNLGADDVITEEFETSVEIFSRVLTKYLVPKDEIEDFINIIREEKYHMVRSISKKTGTINLKDIELHLSDVEIVSFKLNSKSFMIGKSLLDIDLRKKYGVNILAIRRNQETIASPDVNLLLELNDILIMVGEIEKINKIEAIF